MIAYTIGWTAMVQAKERTTPGRPLQTKDVEKENEILQWLSFLCFSYILEGKTTQCI